MNKARVVIKVWQSELLGTWKIEEEMDCVKDYVRQKGISMGEANKLLYDQTV